MSLRWFRGEALGSAHPSELARSGIICAPEWRQHKGADGCGHREFRWAHGSIASFYFAKYIMDELLEAKYEEAKALLLSRFDFFVWRVMFGLSRGKKEARTRLIRLLLELHTHLLDHLFERGLFRLPEFEGIELLLWNSCNRKSMHERRALTNWFILKGDWKKALHVAPVPDVRGADKWTREDACDAACVVEIHMALDDYKSAVTLMLPCWQWWDAVPVEEMTGHWRDFTMVALKRARCMKACKSADTINFFNAAFNMCRKYTHEFALVDRITVFEAMLENSMDVEFKAQLRQDLQQMLAVHGEWTHSNSNALLRESYELAQQGDLERARQCLLRAIDIDDRTLDINDPARAAAWNNLGYAYFSLSNHTQARQCYESAIAIWESGSGKNSAGHARTMVNLAAVVEPKRALELLQKANQLDPKIRGSAKVVKVKTRRKKK